MTRIALAMLEPAPADLRQRVLEAGAGPPKWMVSVVWTRRLGGELGPD